MRPNILLVAIIYDPEYRILLQKTEVGFQLPSLLLKDQKEIATAFRDFILSQTGLYVERLSPVYIENYDQTDQITIGYSFVWLTFKPVKFELPESYTWLEKSSSTKIRELQMPPVHKEILVRGFSNS